jgi:hypothetical protein
MFPANAARNPKAVTTISTEEYLELGIPEEWINLYNR